MADDERSERRQDRRPDAKASRRCACEAATSPRARRSTPGSSSRAATLVLSTFSGSVGGGILTPLRNLVANAGQLRADGPALLAARQHARACAVLGAIGVPLLMLVLAAIAGNMIQHRLVWSTESLTPKFSKVSPRRRLQAHLRQAGAGEFRSRACSSWSRSARS